MTLSLQRTALILLATSAVCASPAAARTHHHHAKKGHHAASHAPAAGANGSIVTLPGEASTYVVKKGDTLAKIADALDTTVADLKRDNRLKGNDLQPGQELKGPAAARKAYVVAHGDTVFSIAKRFHVSVADLRSENDLSGKTAIHSGQKLKLPAGFKAPAGVAEASADEVTPRLRGSHGPQETASDEGGSQRGAAGRVETGAGRAVTYKVRKGDTLDKIADKLGTSVSALKRDNRIRGNAIHPGQVLRGPKSGTSRIYVAASGDTLSGVAERFGVSVQALKSANGLKRRASTIRGGQRLHLPEGARDRGREALDRATIGYPRPAEPGPAPSLPSHPQPYQPSGATPRVYTPPPGAQPQQPPTPPPSALTDARLSELAKGRFAWPLKGAILSDFGAKPGGQNNAGVDIKADNGSPVRAAAEGEVVYAGDQVPGFGNLVLIKHTEGWSTAYAHLGRIEVKMQQKVTQGQEIGVVGSSGGVSEPQLHFEVRYAPNPTERAGPVDPKVVLPK
ncbi:MAG: LysM peptidoglycan-binding domain-containing protein [Phenylobacterium sp.]